MLNFASDYTEGCHPKILEALTCTNMTQLTGYGTDEITDSAKAKIRSIIAKPNADIYFLTGGTQTNQTVIDSMLHMYEGVVAAETGHVNVHEAGAIEFTGHKVLTIPSHQGKILARELEAYLAGFYADSDHEHMVFPGMVYISHPTELGTLYSLAELEDIHQVTDKYEIPLFLDGARLGYGLMSPDTDVSIQDIAELTDVFYIGGTKVGALCGEAVVFPRGNSPKHFVTMIKEHGALLAKGRLNGVQFDTLFTDNLYFHIAENAMNRVRELIEVFDKHGISFFLKSPTNQQFLIMEKGLLQKLDEAGGIYSAWEPYDDNHMVVRFCTSWATSREQIQELDQILDELMEI